MIALVLAAMLVVAMIWKNKRPDAVVKTKDRYTRATTAEVVRRWPIIRRHPGVLRELSECRPLMDAGAFRKLCKSVAGMLRPGNEELDPIFVAERLTMLGGLAAEGVVQEVVTRLRGRSTKVSVPSGMQPQSMWSSS